MPVFSRLNTLLLKIITGEIPFGKTMHNAQVLLKMQEHCLRPDRPPNVSDDLWNLIVQCWAQNPEDRPNISEVLSLLEVIIKLESEDRIALQTD